jgi:hypothetical protein
MRGVVTLAAAQALPDEVPHRALLICVAFLVATVAVAELFRRVRTEVVNAQRQAWMIARDEGTFSAGTLTAVLEALDAEEISVELRLVSQVGTR